MKIVKLFLGFVVLFITVIVISSVFSSSPDDSAQDNTYTSAEKDSIARQEKIEALFSAWDGSCRPMEKAIKNGMNDPDSYEHVSTVYFEIPDTNYIVVKTSFRGRNGFGGIVTQHVMGNVYFDGSITEFQEQ